MIYIYINSRVKDDQLRHYLIGDGLNEVLYLSFNTDLVEVNEDGGLSRVTPYSKLATSIPLKIEDSSSV